MSDQAIESAGTAEVPEYGYATDEPQCTVDYLPQVVDALLPALQPGARVLDVGCGNGFWAARFLERGCTVVGIDPSREGIDLARRNHPGGRYEVLEVHEGLLESLGEEPFDVVMSLEVVEHLYLPRPWAIGCFGALRPGGRLVCSTPYHGYLKNLVLALTDHWDAHLHALWDGGHIKFFSRATLTALLDEAGFTNIRFRGAGRLPWLWKSMVLAGDRPGG